MALVASVPLADIERISIYVNETHKSLSTIKAETSCDYVINGGFYELSNWKPVMNLKVEGSVYSSTDYDILGFGWNSNDIKALHSNYRTAVKNFINGIPLIEGGKCLNPLQYDSSLGGARGRSAIALTKTNELLLYCIGDTQVGKCTPEELRDTLFNLGATDAIMLDGGASAQCSFQLNKVTSSRAVHNYILIYLKVKEDDKMPIVYLDPGHGGDDNSNGSPDGTYKEHMFSLDIGNRIKQLLISQGVKCYLTRTTDCTLSLADRASIANKAKANLFVSLHSNAAPSTGWSSASGLCIFTCASGGVRDKMANNILNRMRAKGVKIFNSALYHQGFAVLVKTNMPACLIEYAFHTNKEDVALLKTEQYKNTLALATAQGICDTLGLTWKEVSKKYTVTIGTFSSKSAAEAVVSKLSEIGLNATIKEE